MILIIAEKPSVASELAKVVGAHKKEQGFFSGKEYLVSWCVGHLIELAKPEQYDESLKSWKLDTLPIIPSVYQTQVCYNTSSQYHILKTLMNRSDVNELIEATDAGREGELIFRLVYHQVECKKPFRRLWISSMEEKSILDGMASLKDSANYDNLYQAAFCRQRADWLIGINLTRLYSTMYNTTLTCGRVQTPTVQMIVAREREIKQFTPQTYYTISACFETFKASCKAETKQLATQILADCNTSTAVVIKSEKQQKTESPTPLYDLTSLQRDANRLLGYSAQQTLDYLQKLYDNKLATYPRTDSRYITKDQTESVKRLLDTLLSSGIFKTLVLKNYSTENVKISQIVNNKKVTDHHAILPTTSITSEKFQQLPSGEKNIFLLIAYRLFSAVYLPHQYFSSKLVLDIAGYSFSASGREDIQEGFQFVEHELKKALNLSQSKTESESYSHLPPLVEGSSLTISKMFCEEKKTKPPISYTEDTLLKAMETAGKKIDDSSLQDIAKTCGLGTPATRAGIIENIIKTGYIRREGKKLLPTETAYTFIDIVDQTIKDPILTAEWEKQLAEIQSGTLSADCFMQNISQFIQSLVQKTKQSYADNPNHSIFQKCGIAVCPKCGKQVLEYPKSYSCESGKNGCGFVIWKQISQKNISQTQAVKLISKGKTDLIKGFISKNGKPFDAYLVFKEDKTIGFQFP